jgi:simple sugar transport system permease protein
MIDFINSAIRLSIPLLFLASGEMVAETTGVLNLGLEGMLLGAALAAAVGGSAAGSVVVGTLTAIGAAAAIALLTGLLVVRLRADQIVVGLAANILVLGLTTYLFRSIYATSSPTIPGMGVLKVPVLSRIPVLGPTVFSQRPLFYLLLGILPGLWWLLNRTPWGLHARACGDAPDALDAAGISVGRVRMQAQLICGIMAGLAGAYLLLGETQTFTEGMSGGRGFVAIAAVVFGSWSVAGTAGAAILFGAAIALQFQLPALGVKLPNQLLLAIPYLVALIGIVLLPQRQAAPATLLRPFRRGER